MSSELKPCPFCSDGGNPYRHGYWVDCLSCHATAPITVWNQRAERTCIAEWKYIGGDVAAGYCECGTELDRCHDYEPAHLPNFCPVCGRKVVE